MVTIIFLCCCRVKMCVGMLPHNFSVFLLAGVSGTRTRGRGAGIRGRARRFAHPHRAYIPREYAAGVACEHCDWRGFVDTIVYSPVRVEHIRDAACCLCRRLAQVCLFVCLLSKCRVLLCVRAPQGTPSWAVLRADGSTDEVFTGHPALEALVRGVTELLGPAPAAA